MLNAKYMHSVKHCQEVLLLRPVRSKVHSIWMKKQKEKEKDPHAVHLGQLGGRARRRKLTPEQRREIARKAAEARWTKSRRTKAES